MPPSTSTIPTLRQQRLGVELRKLREHAGLSTVAAAALLGGPQGRISNIEAGRYAVSADRVRALAHHYACFDQQLIDSLAGMTGGRTRGWWDEYREVLSPAVLDIAELEHHASALRVAVVAHMPGLLQTLEHARATFRELVPALLPHEVEHRVSYRLKRQTVLFGDSPAPYAAIMHESALRMGFGGPAVAREQLEHLLVMSELSNVTVVIVPFGVGFPGSGQPISYALGPVPDLDTVLLDTDHGCEYLDARAQLAKYRSILDRMEDRALQPAASRDLIRRVARDL